MTESFISTKDRIISTAIDIISESGLSNLTTKTVSAKANLSEPLLYRFYGDVDELLVDVVSYYFRFDKGIRKTIQSKEGTHLEKIRAYVENYAIYYENYFSLSTLMLQYEELLHNPATREPVMEGMRERRNYLAELFQAAIDAGEVKAIMDGFGLSDSVHGYFHAACLCRRCGFQRGSFRKEIFGYIDRMIHLISTEENGGTV